MELTKEQIEYLTATIKSIPFFERCGIKEELELPFCSRQVGNWQEAKENYNSYWWRNVGNEATNRFREHLRYIRYPTYYCQSWNDFATQIRDILLPLFKNKAIDYMTTNSIDNLTNRLNLYTSTRWHILNFAMEYIYKKQRPPTTFFTDLVEGVYMKGHFPCGWDMGLPETVFADEDYEIPWKGKYPAFGHLLYI